MQTVSSFGIIPLLLIGFVLLLVGAGVVVLIANMSKKRDE